MNLWCDKDELELSGKRHLLIINLQSNQVIMISPYQRVLSIRVRWKEAKEKKKEENIEEDGFSLRRGAKLLHIPVFFATLWTIAPKVPLSMEFPRQEYWSGLPCPFPRDLCSPGIKPESLKSPALASQFFTTSTTWKGSFRWKDYTKITSILSHLYMHHGLF